MRNGPKPISLVWPVQGFVDTLPYSDQPPNVTFDCMNVRNFESEERKLRGGQREGLSKKFPGLLPGAVQLISSQTEVVSLNVAAAFTSRFANATTDFGINAGCVRAHPSGNFVAVAGGDTTSAATVAIYAFSSISGWGARTSTASPQLTGADNVRDIAWDSTGTYLAICPQNTGIDGSIEIYSFNTSTGVLTYVSTYTLDVEVAYAVTWHPTKTWLVACYLRTANNRVRVRAFNCPSGVISTVGSTQVDYATATAGHSHNTKFAPNGNYLAHSNSLSPYLYTIQWNNGTNALGVSTAAVGTSDSEGAVSYHPDGAAVAKTSTGSVFVHAFDVDAVTGAITNKATNPVTLPTGIGRDIAFSPDGDYLAVGHGTSPRITVYPWAGAFGIKIANPSSLPATNVFGVGWNPDSLVLFGAIDSGSNPRMVAYEWTPAQVNPTAARKRVLVIAGGNFYQSDAGSTVLSLVLSGTAVTASSGVVRGVEAFQKFYFCDSIASHYSYFDYADQTIHAWTAGGDLPIGTVDATAACRIMAFYNGRVCLAGLVEDPFTLFMSASGDPDDFDYSPAVESQTMAVAINAEDVVTCLAPFNNDIMIIGCDHTIWMMNGDPAAGGRIDNLSREIGIVGPEAYCFDPRGNLYFLGGNGLYRINAGAGGIEHVSGTKLERTFAEIDYSTTHVMMCYNQDRQGIHMMLIPYARPAVSTTSLFWDARTDSFWPEQYPAGMGPSALHAFNGDGVNNRAVLVGGFDGYVRFLDMDAKSDDGTAISSRMRFAAITPGGTMGSGTINDITFVMDEDSDNTTFTLYAADTPGKAAKVADANGVPAFRRSLTGGRNNSFQYKVSQNTFLPVISQSTVDASWVYESGSALINQLNRMRGRRVS